MRKLLYIFVIFASLCVSCETESVYSGSDSVRDNLGVYEQTTIMYFMGTSLKSSYFDVYNIPDAQSAVAAGALGSNGRLLVFMPNSSGYADLYEMYESGGECKCEVVATYDSNESLDQDRMVDVIAKSKSFAPANTYNIIFSGHGTGWVSQNHLYLRSVDSSFVDWDAMGSGGGYVTRFVGSNSDGILEIEELREALEQTNTKFGYLLFDMCFMSNVETLYELKDVCSNVIASPCEVMADGFPYKTILPELFTDDGRASDLGGACYAYYDHYLNHNSTPYGAVAWCVTSGLEDVATAMQQINEAGIVSVDIDDLQCYEPLSSHVFCDLGHYVSEACSDETLLAEFESVFDLAFPIEGRWHTAKFLSTLNSSWFPDYINIDDANYTGISTSEPSLKFQDEWVETSWAKATAKAAE